MGRQHPGKHDPHKKRKTKNKQTKTQTKNQTCEASWIVFITVWYKFSRRDWIRNIFGILTELNFYYSFLKEVL